MIRRVGDARRAGEVDRPRPGAFAVLTRGDQMLVTFQAEPDYEFQLPGGGIDPGESPVVALHREVREETGWSISRVTRLGAYRRFTYMPEYNLWADKICTIYAARPATRIGPPTEEGHTAFWLPIDQAIPILANLGDQHFAEIFVSQGP